MDGRIKSTMECNCGIDSRSDVATAAVSSRWRRTWYAQYHQASAELPRGELDVADERRGHDVAGDANHEQIAQSLIEHYLDGYA